MTESMNRRTFATAFVASAVANAVASALPAAARAPRTAVDVPPSDFLARLPEIMEVAEVPGVAMAVVRGGRVAWQERRGVADLRTNRPVAADTLWAAASLGKPVFALGVLRLVDEGKLDLDRPLVEIDPSLPFSDERAKRVTARHVLSHATGFPNWRDGADEPLVPAFEPGSKFRYSGEGFYYLQRVVERIAGAGVDRYMRDAVFAPLGMASTTYAWRADTAARVVAGHDRGTAYDVFWKDEAADLTRYAEARGRALSDLTSADVVAAAREIAPNASLRPNNLMPNAASSMLTTPADYGAFLVELLGDGPPRAGVSARSRAASLVPRTPINRALAWGLGWGLELDASGRPEYAWHWGDNGSWKNFVVAHPASRSAVVVFTNGSRGLNLARRVVTAATGRDHDAFLWL